MFGNIPDLINKGIKNGGIPINKSIGDKSIYDINLAIYTEYWREVIKTQRNTEFTTIKLQGFGVFDVTLSHLKQYIFSSIRRLRKIKKKVEYVRSLNPEGLDESNLKTFLEYESLIKNIKTSWKQLEVLRMIIIIRTIAWNQKLRDKGEENKIKIDYKPTQYSFVEYYIKHKKLPHIDIY